MINTDRPTSVTTRRTGWFKASYSNNSNACVEVRFDGEFVHIRDSKYLRDPTNDPAQQPIITVTADQWSLFLSEMTGATPPTPTVRSRCA